MSRWLVPTSVSVLWNIPNLPGLVGPWESPARAEMMPPFTKMKEMLGWRHASSYTALTLVRPRSHPSPSMEMSGSDMEGIPSKSLNRCTHEITHQKTSHLQLEGTGSLGVHGQRIQRGSLESESIMHCRGVRLAVGACRIFPHIKRLPEIQDMTPPFGRIELFWACWPPETGFQSQLEEPICSSHLPWNDRSCASCRQWLCLPPGSRRCVQRLHPQRAPSRGLQSQSNSISFNWGAMTCP